MSRNGLFLAIAKLFCSSFFVLALSFPCFAEVTVKDDQSDSETKSLKETPPVTTVVSATRREISLEKSTRFVTVINREEIEKGGKVYVADILRAQPGVTVTQSGPSGRTVNVYLRGTNANQTLVMLDGIVLNSPTTGAAELADLTLENIDRIEILRGPQSVLYGSAALGGVINIMTKAGGKPGLHANTQFEYGNYRTFYETGGISGEWKRFAFSGSGTRFDSKGPFQNSGAQDTRAFGHGKIQVTDNSELDVVFHHFNALVGIQDGPFNQDPNKSSRSSQQALNTTYNFSLVDGWQQSLKYTYFHDFMMSNDPPDPGTAQVESPNNLFRLITNRHNIGYQSDVHIKDFDVLSFGYEFEDARSNNKLFNKIVHNNGWFLQNELTLWEIWTIAGGVHIDQNTIFGTAASPLVSSGLWIEKTMTRLKGSFGKGYRAPSFNELFYPGYGNPNLQPETNWGWDAGFEQFYWGKKGMFSADYFHNSIKNLIQTVFIGNSLYEAQNISRAMTQGVELENKITLVKNLTFRTNYTYTDAVDESTGKRLVRRPWHEGKVGLSYSWWRLNFSGDASLIGTREDKTGLSGRPPREKNPGYTRIDLTLSYDVTRYFQIYARGENVLNKHYSEVLGYQNPFGRFFVGTKVKF